jgi:hypothetical protein
VAILLLIAGVVYNQYSHYFNYIYIDLSRHGHIQDQINHINHAPILLPTAKPIVKKLHGLEHDEKKEQNLQDKEEIKRKQKMLYILNKLERLVHIDLKGAPPKPDYFKEFLPLIKKYGATGVILEYEDMFPYTGRLSVVKHGNAYSKDDIKLILKLAKDNNLTVMPLVEKILNSHKLFLLVFLKHMK